jgi:cytochrome oxidase Cu insertion factor (SCO1/SenC/PrrC family)
MVNNKRSKVKHQQLLQLSIAVLLIMLFLVGCGNSAAVSTSQTPPETSTPEPPVVNDPLRAGDMAPDFTLPDSNGNMVSLADELQDNQMVVLVFYNSHA